MITVIQKSFEKSRSPCAAHSLAGLHSSREALSAGRFRRCCQFSANTANHERLRRAFKAMLTVMTDG